MYSATSFPMLITTYSIPHVNSSGYQYWFEKNVCGNPNLICLHITLQSADVGLTLPIVSITVCRNN